MSNGEMIVGGEPRFGVGELVGGAGTSQAVALAGAILDKRIATARSFPRSVSTFKRTATELLQQDVETARSAEYAKPVGGGKVTGPSVRLAELAAMCWTNLEVEIMEPIVGEKSVTVQAFAWDLEKNYRAPGIATTSILNRDGVRYAQHMIETTCAATASKARRNAILAVIPRAYVTDLLEAAKKVASQNMPPLEKVRADWLEWFARNHRITNAQVFAYLEVEGADDITAEQCNELAAVVTAIKEGEPVEAFFGKPASKSDAVRDKLAAKKQGDTKGKSAPTCREAIEAVLKSIAAAETVAAVESIVSDAKAQAEGSGWTEQQCSEGLAMVTEAAADRKAELLRKGK